MNPIKAALLVLVLPNRFERIALNYALKYEAGINQEFRRRFEGGQLAPDTVDKLRNVVSAQIKALRNEAFGSFGLCLATIAAGYVSGYVLHLAFGVPAKSLVYAIQAIGASAILGATISANPKEIETFDRESLVETIHEAFFRGIVALGTFVFVLSVAWDSL